MKVRTLARREDISMKQTQSLGLGTYLFYKVYGDEARARAYYE